MSREDFDRFVQRKKEEQAAAIAVFDDKKQLEEWHTYLDDLYHTIEIYLDKYLKKNRCV